MRGLSTILITSLILTIPCAGRTIVVETDGSGEYATIQQAIDNAVNGDAVELQPGTYTGNGNRDIDFLGKAITVRSTDPNDWTIVEATVIDCQATEGDRHNGFNFLTGEEPNSVLAGVTITGGYGYQYCGVIAGWGGGAIFVSDSSPTITHCRIVGNVADNGGGIACTESRLHIKNCIISGNSSSTFGGAILIYGHHYPSSDYNPEIINCTITDNVSGYGGGICTVLKSIISIQNCVVWGNDALNGSQLAVARIFDAPWAYITVSYSDFQGGDSALYGFIFNVTWGPGNIDADPLFVDAANGDYHLMRLSPCMNAGDPAYVPALDETDIDGDPRVCDGCIDIGADEYVHNVPALYVWPAEIVFNAKRDDANPSEQSIFVQLLGPNPPAWQISEDCDWLDVYPAAGISSGDVNEVTLSVDTYGLEAGTHTCDLVITALGAEDSPATVEVTLNVQTPVTELSKNSFAFTSNYGGGNPPAQTLGIRNAGTCTLNWQITEDCNWLAISPTSGSSSGEVDNVSLSVDITGLPVGQYNCQFEVTDPCAANSPQTVTVALTVNGPILELPTRDFRFYGWDGTASQGKIMPIENIGGGNLEWSISFDCPWLTADPPSGTVPTGQVSQVQISASSAGLVAAVYETTLTVSSSDTENSPQTVHLRLGPECYTGLQPGQWEAVERPEGWCSAFCPRQCHGDADCSSQGKKTWWVSTDDLEVLLAAWNHPYYPGAGTDGLVDEYGNHRTINVQGQDIPLINADFDHLPQGKSGYRVSTYDLDILLANWNTNYGPLPDCQ